MQNDMLKNNIAPWQEKGRWYHAYVNSDGTSWSIDKTKCDKLFTNSMISTNYLVINDTIIDTFKHVIMDVKFKFHSPFISGTAIPLAYFMPFYSSTRQNILLCPPATYIGDIDIWIFISE